MIPRPYRRFTVVEYEWMAEIGILKEDEPIELIRGEIVEMAPIGTRHVACVRRTTRACHRQLGDSTLVYVQSPIRLPDDGEPRPDVVLARPAVAENRLPEAVDILLVVEVADASIEYDRGIKLPLYAAASIPEAWLFDLVANRIERHSDPSPGGYQTVVAAESGQRLASSVLPDLVFDVADLIEFAQHDDG